MSETDKISYLEEIFKAILGKDPKIIIKDHIIYLVPYYWNYSFITNFLPLIGCLYVLITSSPTQVKIVFILLLFFSFYFLIWAQLRFYNKIKINTKNTSFEIIPNSISRIIYQKKIIRFGDIESTGISTNGYWITDKRYIIWVSSVNYNKIQIISTKSIETAKEIEVILNKLMTF